MNETIEQTPNVNVALVDGAPAAKPVKPLDIELQRLAALIPLEYEGERKKAAKDLGLRLAVLDGAVRNLRRADASLVGRGRRLELSRPEVWPEPVNGTELLDALSATARRYVVMDDAAADAVALWVLAVYAFEQFPIFPRLAITSPEKRCGKTTLLDVLGRLVPRPLIAANVTAAAIFRTIETVRPTLLIDEADTFLRKTKELHNVLNSGHRRDGTVFRCSDRDAEPRQFSTWSPAAIATIGRLPGTLEDRAIIIHLRRRQPHETVAPLRIDRANDLRDVPRKAARWTLETARSIAAAEPAMPPGLVDRLADNWRPLLAIADAIGGDWPSRARHAALALSGAGDGDESTGVRLLSDLRELFYAESSGVLFSEEIIQRLGTMEDRPWAEFLHGRPITKPQVAKLLKPFAVSPGTVRRGHETSKGYRRDHLADAFWRYLPDNVTPSQSAKSTTVSPSPASHPVGCYGSRPGTIPQKPAGCDGVTAKTAIESLKHDDILEIPAFLRRLPQTSTAQERDTL